MDLEIDDNYKVEHDANFVLNDEQLRKLISEKFKRNSQFAIQVKQRESQLKHVD